MAFAANSAHVVKVEPFANHAQDVDSEAGYSINYGPGGAEHFPLAGKPSFDQGGTRLIVPVQLKPNQAYSLVLTPVAFRTKDGYPLMNYEISFKTR